MCVWFIDIAKQKKMQKKLFYYQISVKSPFGHLCLDISQSAKRTYLGGMPPFMPPWVVRRLNQYGGVFGGVSPRYVRFDPPLNNKQTTNK